MQYLLKTGKHYVAEEGRLVRKLPGDIVELTAAEAESFGGKFEKLQSAPDAGLTPTDPLELDKDAFLGAAPTQKEGAGSPPSDPTGKPPEAGGDNTAAAGPVHIGGGWFQLPNGEKIQGKEPAEEAYRKLIAGSSKEE